MTFSLSELGFHDLGHTTEMAQLYSAECSQEAFVSLESNRLSELLTGIANHIVPSRSVNYTHSGLPPVALLDKVLSAKGFTAVRNTQIQVPQGLNVMLDQYVDYYEKLTFKLGNLPKALDMFYRMLGNVLNQTDLAQAQSALLDLHNLPSIPTLEDHRTLVGMFDPSDRTTVPFGATVNRVNEYIAVYNRIDALGKKAMTVSIADIAAKLQRFDPIVKSLRDQLLKDNVPVSGPFVSRLIDHATTLATSATLASSYKHAITELVETTRANYDLFTKSA